MYTHFPKQHTGKQGGVHDIAEQIPIILAKSLAPNVKTVKEECVEEATF